jgi:hypothetical protein
LAAGGAIGLALWKPRRDQTRIILGWVLSSYLFWAIVPNRQFRYLLPGLPGVAILMAAYWPRLILCIVAALQVLTALTMGWQTNRINREYELYEEGNWQISEILHEAHSLRKSSFAVSNLTLVANHAYFNGNTFVWMDKDQGLTDIHLRAANSRLSELSEFVVYKTSNLGPPCCIQNLPEAASVIDDPKSWFHRAYAASGTWPLPDDSRAVLYEQRVGRTPPISPRRFSIAAFSSKTFTAQNLKVDLGPWDPAAGDYPLAKASASAILLRGLKVSHLEFWLHGFSFAPSSPQKPLAMGDWRMLKISRLQVRSAQVDEKDLADFIENRARGLKVERLTFNNGQIGLKARWKGLPMEASAAIWLDQAGGALKFRLLSFGLGPIRLPQRLISVLSPYSISLKPNPETPFAVEVGNLTLAKGRLVISAL